MKNRLLCIVSLGGALWGAGVLPATAAPGAPRADGQGRAAWVALREVARFYGFRSDSGPDPHDTLLYDRAASLLFKPDDQCLLVDGIRVHLQHPMVYRDADWTLRSADVDTLILPLLQPWAPLQGLRAGVVVLDPGHGGKDGGAVGPGGALEKDVVLDLALRVRDVLRAAGLTVFMTRETDVFVELEERTRLAGRVGADVFLSLHLNSVDRPDVRGVETYLLPGSGRAQGTAWRRRRAASALLAYRLQRQVVRRARAEDRGLRYGDFSVLRTATCPAALVECAFLSNHGEEKRLLDPAYREQLVEGIARGVLDYAGTVRRASLWPSDRPAWRSGRDQNVHSVASTKLRPGSFTPEP